MKRHIPATMATQHPDNAMPAPFTGKAFISAREEIEECYYCFSKLGVEEYMWDWEGKFVDEAVMERLFSTYYSFFRAHPLGKEIFLTFRIPNIWEETSAKLPRAFMNLIAAEQVAKQYGMYRPPLFEVILPMTTRSKQLIYLQEKFVDIAASAARIFELRQYLKHVEVIPLFEDVDTMAESDIILAEYVDFLAKTYRITPSYLRVFIARSDPAMNAGLIPTMLAVKHALYRYHRFGEARGIRIHPWVGGGSLPFRGGINPRNVEATLEEYEGVSSLTVQSAFRFDYPEAEVKEAIATFNRVLPKNRKKYPTFTKEEERALKDLNTRIKPFFTQVIEPLAPLINTLANHLPNHRERVQHVGMFGYARGVGKVKLPRAIKFCGAFYSLGIPPEIIGTGRALKEAKDMGLLSLVLKTYKHIRRDLLHAGHYLNRENLSLIIKEFPEAEVIWEDIKHIESLLNISLGPEHARHMIHRNLTSNIYHKLLLSEPLEKDILESAKLRRSLG